MGKGSQAPDLSSSQINSAMAGLQSSQPQSLGISTGMDAIPSMNSQWAGKNSQPGYGDDMRFPGQGGMMTGWQPPGQVMRPPGGGWGQQPMQQASDGSTGASAALNILNNTNPAQPGMQPPPGQLPPMGRPMGGWGMQRKWQNRQPMQSFNSGGLQVAIPSPDATPGLGNI